MNMKFKPGRLLATPGALELQANLEGGRGLLTLLARHLDGDWGDISEADKKENDLSMEKGFRILSSYDTNAGKLWILTEADRSATTFLLPEDY